MNCERNPSAIAPMFPKQGWCCQFCGVPFASRLGETFCSLSAYFSQVGRMCKIPPTHSSFDWWPTMRFGIRAAAALIATVGTNSFASAFTTGSSRVRPPTSHLAMSTLPSWSDLQSSASSTPVGAALDNEVALRPTGRAAPFVQNKLRLFNSEDFSAEKPPKITLYRDHAGWCPYCQSECGAAVLPSPSPS